MPMNAKRTVDRQWIESAVEQFEGPLTIYANRLLGDVDRARDVVQDAFLKLWQADRAAVEGHLAKWLYTVCRNRVLDVRRKERRMTRLRDSQVDSASAKGGDSGPYPFPASGGGALAGGGEDSAGLLALVANLPDRQQEAVRLKFQADLSYREIAEVMNTTVNNVGVLLHTAIKNIRSRLAESSDSTTAREAQ